MATSASPASDPHALWREAKRAMDDAARAYLAGAPDAVERATAAVELARQAEATLAEGGASGGPQP